MTASGRESVFTMDTSSIKYGPGSTREVGDDARDRGLKRVMLFTDANLAGTDGYATARDSLKAAGLDVIEYCEVRVEPTDASFARGDRRFANDAKPDGFVAVGGGSVIDTAKAANLYATLPGRLPDLRQRADRPGRRPCRARSSR